MEGEFHVDIGPQYEGEAIRKETCTSSSVGQK